jgi:hypothetical protein
MAYTLQKLAQTRSNNHVEATIIGCIHEQAHSSRQTMVKHLQAFRLTRQAANGSGNSSRVQVRNGPLDMRKCRNSDICKTFGSVLLWLLQV